MGLLRVVSSAENLLSRLLSAPRSRSDKVFIKLPLSCYMKYSNTVLNNYCMLRDSVRLHVAQPVRPSPLST